MSKNNLFIVTAFTIVLMFSFIFFIIPNAMVLYTTFNVLGVEDGNENYIYNLMRHVKIVFNGLYLKIYLRSLMVGLCTVFFTIIIGYPFACAVYYTKSISLQRFLLASVIIPFWTSSLIRTYSMVSLLRTHGFINKFLLSIGLINQPLDMLYNLTAMVIGFTYTLIPLMVLPIYLSLFKIKSAVIEAAKDLGANNTQIFFSILLPLSYGGIVSGSSMVLLSSLSMFYLSDILGGSKYNLVGNLIKNKFLLSHDWQLSCSISLIFYVVAAFFLVLQKRTLSFKLPSS